jgi:aspartyl-tRNA(Asn)/glutamyl-tRNA(Gln) amidotransferase subunit C
MARAPPIAESFVPDPGATREARKDGHRHDRASDHTLASAEPAVLHRALAMSDAGSPPIHRDEALTIARLAHLELSSEEIERLTSDLGNILAYVRQLEELDVSAVPPTAHVQIERLPLRADEETPSLPHGAALSEAPMVQDEGFAVPAFVDEG